MINSPSRSPKKVAVFCGRAEYRQFSVRWPQSPNWQRWKPNVHILLPTASPAGCSGQKTNLVRIHQMSPVNRNPKQIKITEVAWQHIVTYDGERNVCMNHFYLEITTRVTSTTRYLHPRRNPGWWDWRTEWLPQSWTETKLWPTNSGCSNSTVVWWSFNSGYHQPPKATGSDGC